MKIFFITILMIMSQIATAKINDFNSLIKEHSKNQNELHKSISSTFPAESTESSDVDPDKKVEVIVLDSNREVYSAEQAPKKLYKKTISKKKFIKGEDIEEKQFFRLGEELENAQ